MAAPALLRLLCQAVVDNIDAIGFGDVALDVHTQMVEAIWQSWSAQSGDIERRADVETLAIMSSTQLLDAVATELDGASRRLSENEKHSATNYLVHVPGAIRRRCRRPADVRGISMPPEMPLQRPLDVLALLPQNIPWYMPGDQPSDIGQWELVHLTRQNKLGEIWQARNPNAPDVPPVFLMFCLNSVAKEKLLRPDAVAQGATLDRVAQEINHPNILQLRRLHLTSEPPCLEYGCSDGVPLASLIQEWYAGDNTPTPATVSEVLCDIATTVGTLHALTPPLVHRDLNPHNILVTPTTDGKFSCTIADVGLRELVANNANDGAHSGGNSGSLPPWAAELALQSPSAAVYRAPEDVRGHEVQPRDDVYALGILWYHMLSGHLGASRPGGSQWRRRLKERGMTEELLELLETCFEDDPNYRPNDAGALAKDLRTHLGLKTAPPPTPPPVSAPASADTPVRRTRARRADVWQLFDTLDEKAPELAKTVTNCLGIKFVLIPAGTFMMGAPEGETGARENETPYHEVTITTPFYMATVPITQQHYLRVMGNNPSRFHPENGGSADHPVENVTWNNAVELCRHLSEWPEETSAHRVYRLPTEAEWEYACRAGSTSPFAFGETLTATQANFNGAFPYGPGEQGRNAKKTLSVGHFPPNNWGLHDMHGNVWEWCADWLDNRYYEWTGKRDPKGPESGQYRVVRGGSWRNHAVTCRAAYRNGLNPRLKDSVTGFRLVFNQ